MAEGAKNAMELVTKALPDLTSNGIIEVWLGLIIICMLFVYFFGKLFPRE